MRDLFPGFDRLGLSGDGVELNVLVGGAGPPLALLHGYPQCHATWHRVAGELARHFTCVIPDLRGYGESGVPDAGPDGAAYSKRAMAADIVAMMKGLGHTKFSLIGHDRGARVAYRLALDHPDSVDRLAIIEVVPTGEMWRNFSAEMAMSAYHWTFLAQPAPLPERMIGADPVSYLDWTLRSWTKAKSLEVFDPAALEAYRAAVRDPARIAAMCADYRAGATLDRACDEADFAAGRTISAPVHFLWSDHGFPAKTGDPLGIWRRWADQVTGQSVDAGHFAQEENPDAVLAAVVPFLRDEA